MTTVGVRELKVHLSHYIGLVCGGEEVMVTKRGKTVARIVAEPRPKVRLRDELAALAADGLVSLPSGQSRRRASRLVKAKGRPVSDLVLEGRR